MATQERVDLLLGSILVLRARSNFVAAVVYVLMVRIVVILIEEVVEESLVE